MRELDFAHKHFNKVMQMVMQNAVKMVQWHHCTARCDDDQTIPIDAGTLRPQKDGTIKIVPVNPERTADASTDYLLRMALTRRGLAFHQASFMDFNTHEQLV